MASLYDAFLGGYLAPNYIPGSATYNQWPINQPGLFDPTTGLNQQWGSGGPGDPTTGLEAQSPDQWVQGSTLFTKPDTRNIDQINPAFAPLANLFLRSDTPSGLGTPTFSAPQGYWDLLAQAIQQGVIAPTARGQQFLSAVASPGGPAAQSGGITSLARALAGPAGTPSAGGAAGAVTTPDYSGASQYGGITSSVFGAIPGTPIGTMPTVQLRQLLEQSLEADRQAGLARDQFNYQMSLGNQQLALQAKTQADDLALRARQLDMQAGQFSQTFGLQQQEQAFRQQLATQQLGEQTREFNVGQSGVLDNGQETLAGRAQRLQEEQAYQQLAAHPENLIQAALMQGARRPGGMPVDASMTTPVDASGNPIGAPGVAQGALGGSGLVPLPGVIAALLQGKFVPGYGAAGAQGALVPLSQLQNDPSLRLNAGSFDLASLSNLGQTERGYLASVLGAQGQDVNAFNQAVQKAGSGQRASALVPAL